MFGKIKEELKNGNTVEKTPLQENKNFKEKGINPENHRKDIWEGRDNKIPYDDSWENIQIWSGADIEGNPDNDEVALEVWLGMKRP